MAVFFCRCLRMEARSTARHYPRCRPCPGCGTTLAAPLTARETPLPHDFAPDSLGTMRCRRCELTEREVRAAWAPTPA